jgi:hypothetical protein
VKVEKIYLTDFRDLAQARRLRACWRSSRFDREPPPRDTRVARPSRRTEKEPTKRRSKPFVDWELAVAYCCGQTGGSSVIAPEITEHFFHHRLWTGDADV